MSLTSAGEQRRDGFVKEKVVFNELILLLIGHFGEWVIFAGELAIETIQSPNGHGLDFATFGAGTVRRQRDACNAIELGGGGG